MSKELQKELMKVGPALLVSIVIGAQILSNAGNVNAVAPISLPYTEDYESTATGFLPSSHELLAGIASVEAGTQANGTPGKMIKALSGSLIRLTGLGDVSDFSFSADIHDEFESAIFGMRMSPDGNNGYLAYYDPYLGAIVLYRVDSGVRTELARTQIKSGGTWFRPIFEARGNELRVVVVSHTGIVSGEARVKDSTYATGNIFLGKDAGHGGKAAHIDNLSIVLPTAALSSVVPTSMPLVTGLDLPQLSSIDGILQHPNLKLVRGGYNIAPWTQLDGSTGNTIWLSSDTLLETGLDNVGDVSLSVDVSDSYESATFGIRMSPDAKSGYLAYYDPYLGAIVVYRVDGGVRTQLGKTFIRSGSNWLRFYFEARGSEIRVAVGNHFEVVSGEVRVNDSTYSSGKIFLSKDAGRGFRLAYLDNLLIESPAPLVVQPVAPTPFSATLESVELASIDNIQQHPNLDLAIGGNNIFRAIQKDGSLGNVLLVQSGASETVKVSAPSDVAVSADLYDGLQGGIIGIRLSPDHKNGYGAVYHSYFGTLQVVKFTDGVRTILAETPSVLPANSWNRVTITALGSSLTAKNENGTEVSATDSSYTSGGIALMKATEWGDDAARFDNILVQKVVSDDTPPETTIVSAPLANSAIGDAIFTFEANEEATFECRLDGGAFMPCASPKSYIGLAEGEHVFEVRATDLAGNVDPTPAIWVWNISFDSDNDGVADSADSCQNSVVEAEPAVRHYSWLGGTYLKTRDSKTKALVDSEYSMTVTRGCTCAQIIALKPGENSGEDKQGCSKGTMENFINQRPTWSTSNLGNSVWLAFMRLFQRVF